ncbi:helix-turn-helix domain-containing protein [Clostridium gasigenes]|uniref:Helix-turn-helix n=1 Tax=Clostridium gasigenes TaxID=94869 RepID=A0A1H0N267_9CLOT|nr:helix-turn-helix transcriptional regulator [Clostridium gasigenes]SDO86722.1 Helix-turn-helix [Clostridium gasigenes]
MISFGDQLKQLRKTKGLTQQQLADKFYLNKSSVSRYENNTQLPENELLQKIADFFNVSIDYLLGRNENSTNFFNGSTDLTIPMTEVEWQPVITHKDKLDITKESEQMIVNIDKAETVEFCGTPADDEDKEFLRMAYERFLTDVRIYNKQKYTPKKYKK